MTYVSNQDREATYRAENVSMIGISAISKLLNDASINSDPKALADMILKLSSAKTNVKVVDGDTLPSTSKLAKRSDSEKRGDSLHNWLSAAGTVVINPYLPISPVRISTSDFDSSGSCDSEASQDRIPLPRSNVKNTSFETDRRQSPGGRLNNNEQPELRTKISNGKRKSAAYASIENQEAWREPRLSSIYFRRGVR